jgi:ubiquinone/menaquinone biosynthesis C-methylase UbiE
MKEALKIRHETPFFYDKSPLEFKQDNYENYELSVKPQILLHLADSTWGYYPFQNIISFISTYIQNTKHLNILEIGCGVGRMIATIASDNPSFNCWGIDYSYQMLKQARCSFINGTKMKIDFGNEGFEEIHITSEKISNLSFGLAKAEHLPFENQSQDLIFHSFTFDRMENPIQALNEMNRVLKLNGKLVFITPLNFIKKEHWNRFFPTKKLIDILKNLGFEILDLQDDFIVEQPLDKRGNKKIWNCVAIVCKKS